MARYWLTFDLGFGADYDGLFEWLDEHDAKECTPSTAFFKSKQTVAEIEHEITNILDDNVKARVYLIYMNEDKEQVYGKWLVGKRKAAPWAGYFIPDEDEDDED